MYAIIENGGKQYKVAQGDKLRIDLIRDKAKGDAIVFDRVLMVGKESPQIGQPTVMNARVLATVTDMGEDGGGVKGDKIKVFKKKRRKGYHKMIGHRQRYTDVRIDEIQA